MFAFYGYHLIPLSYFHHFIVFTFIFLNYMYNYILYKYLSILCTLLDVKFYFIVQRKLKER